MPASGHIPDVKCLNLNGENAAIVAVPTYENGDPKATAGARYGDVSVPGIGAINTDHTWHFISYFIYSKR